MKPAQKGEKEEVGGIFLWGKGGQPPYMPKRKN